VTERVFRVAVKVCARSFGRVRSITEMSKYSWILIEAGLHNEENTCRTCAGGFATKQMVPEEGVEPTRPCDQRILSPPRLPFRHSGTVHVNLSYRETSRNPVNLHEFRSSLEMLLSFFASAEFRLTQLFCRAI